jgi:hypothetical protein
MMRRGFSGLTLLSSRWWTDSMRGCTRYMALYLSHPGLPVTEVDDFFEVEFLSCAFDSDWFRYIPLSPTLTSAGAVVRHELASKIQGDPEEAFMGLSVLAQTVDEDTAFREFEQKYRREFGVYHQFLVAFYDLNVNENSYFWSAKKVTKNTSSGLQSFVELVGGVSSGGAALAGPRCSARTRVPRPHSSKAASWRRQTDCPGRCPPEGKET